MNKPEGSKMIRLVYGNGNPLGFSRVPKTFHEEVSTLFGSLAERLMTFNGALVPQEVEIECFDSGNVKKFRFVRHKMDASGEDIGSFIYKSEDDQFTLEVWND